MIMTVLVGLVDHGITYIGSDRGASDGSMIVSMSTPKVFVKDGFVIAFAGSLGVGQLAMYAEYPPLGTDTEGGLRLGFAESMQGLIETYCNPGVDLSDTTFLIGGHGRLFEMSTSDWGVVETNETAVGSGGQVALGSLYTTQGLYSSASTRISMALKAACHYATGCMLPIDIMSA